MIVLTILILLVSGIILDELPDEFTETLKNIRNAESNGADVKDLVEKYNRALSILNEINSNEFVSCPSYDICMEEINNILEEINNVNLPSKQATDLSIFIYAIIAAIIASFALTLSYKMLVYYRTRNFMMKRIRIKEDE
ncbi:MAG: hypothetical protein KatS3mg003_1190 [Candidatus Nitrosocaldaceae archaeon]|nr:MAG: hypothetical protein KatS3mg003_1190 [Candidatus Nitrosocaldaceae archaeon]